MGWNSKYLLFLFMVSTCGFFSVRFTGYELNTMLTQYTRELLHGMGIRDHQSVTIKASPSNATTLKSNATILRSNATSTNAPQKPNVVTPYSGNLTFLQVKAMLEREALSVDYDFARRLRKAQTNANYPFVNDIVVSRRNNSWAVYVVINNGNVMNGRRYTSKMNVVLTVGNKPRYGVSVRDFFKKIVGGEHDLFFLVLAEKLRGGCAEGGEDVQQSLNGRRRQFVFELGNITLGKFAAVGKFFLRKSALQAKTLYFCAQFHSPSRSAPVLPSRTRTTCISTGARTCTRDLRGLAKIYLRFRGFKDCNPKV